VYTSPVPANHPTSAGRSLLAVAEQLLSRRDGRTTVFSSFGGLFSDNPRAIYEELVRRDTALLPVWVADPGRAPSGVSCVTPRSTAYSRVLGSARFLVSNERIPSLLKKPGVTYLQTWHGSMLKRIGYDNPRYAADRAGLRRAASDYRRWDLLISQSPFSTRTMRRAFRYEGEVLEVGYPRNDLLLGPDVQQVRDRVRQQYGVSPDTLLVLYAPTFRDDAPQSSRLPLDLDLVRAALGERVHVLVRLHHRVQGALREPQSAGWSSASEHGDIRELYAACDVLVTDYSSVMFDFAVTRKPMVFFAYDLEHYRANLRGFYFDLLEQAPGPVCRSAEEVVAALADVGGAAARHAAAYASFVETYCPWDDGRASMRVVDRLLREL
jgi:CDP-glycerol glycerophosphotransferase